MWGCFEAVPGLVALEAVWQRIAGEQFEALRLLCLEPSACQVRRVPCPAGCGCNHAVIPRHDGTGAVGVCCCREARCADIPLTLQEFTPLEVSRARLGRALCKAFGLASRQADLLSPGTFQFGSWSTNAVPAILTLQVQRPAFRRVVAEIAAELRQPFMLFAPTSDFVDAPAKAILENHGAAFFALKNNVLLTEHGTLQATRAPGELFARFTPQPKESDVDVAVRAFALVRSLRTAKPLQPPLFDVFCLYCIEERSAAQIAQKCQCSKPTILRRLQLIQNRVGVDPRQLRRLSPHLAKLQDTLKDSRATQIRPESALEQEEEGEI